jgi:hypothetical protein
MKEFIKDMIRSQSGVSSKRVAGIACIVFCMIVFIGSLIVIETMYNKMSINYLQEVVEFVEKGIESFLFVGMVLLGVTLLEKKK